MGSCTCGIPFSRSCLPKEKDLKPPTKSHFRSVTGTPAHYRRSGVLMLLLYFFTGIGLNARLSDLLTGGRPFFVLLALTVVYLLIQNLLAAGSVAVLGLPKGITVL